MKRKTNKLKSLFLLAFLGIATLGFTQKGVITGTLSDGQESLIGASVGVNGTGIGDVTDFNGNYRIEIRPGTYVLTASYTGYTSQEQEVTVVEGETVTANFTLAAGISFDEVIVTGTRASNRTNTDSPVPIDVINVKKLSLAAPQTSVNQLLHQTTPSFSSNTQTISDGTDHIDPASLRGLGPDQVLVLINGKRRHTSSLVNVNGTFGRGNVGTDLNAIPASAIEGIEVLRDGAAAQYGSDAIAGVINIKMKEAVNELSFNLTTGANFTSNIGPFGGETKSIDGEVLNLGVNYGLPVGDQGGFINFTGEFNFRGATNRMQEFSGSIFHGFNAVERIAAADFKDVSSLSLTEVQDYAQDVSYFDQGLKDLINGAPTLDSIATLLNFDATSEELAARGLERSDFNMRVGQSRLRGGKFFANILIPLGENLEFYSFGGMSYRDGESGCFYRLPNQNRTTTAIYPNGTVPRINSNIVDRSIATGIRGMIGDWNIDFSNVFGSNSFLFHMTETHNATLGASSPTTFDAGGHSFTQNTSNFDLSQYFESLGSMKGINIAFGVEYRYENFKVIPGTVDSYGNYDVNGNLVTPTTPDELKTLDFYGRDRPAGAQCFAGFLPFNEVDANRSSAAAYFDAELDVSDDFLVGGAVRFENYSDFGSTFNYKLAARYKVSNNVALRAATSTGFRAPSLHQIHFSRTSTIFELVNGVSVASERGTFANTSRAAKLLGIPELKEETSQNFSAGVTLKIPDSGIRLTLDAYQINIQDRVVLTGAFSPGTDAELISIFEQAQAGSATFFANAIDTRSQGVDVVISHQVLLGANNYLLTNSLAGTFSRTEWDQDAGINSSDILRSKGLEATYFNQESRLYLEQAVPRVKVTLNNTLRMNNWSFYLRNTYFGETTEATNGDGIFDDDLNLLPNATIDPYNSPKIITDLSVAYQFSENLAVTIGANNLLDIYPDEVDDAFISSGRFVYSRRSPQFSFGGRYLFGRLVFTLK